MSSMSSKTEALGRLELLNDCSLATCVEGQPYVRPMSLIFREGRFFFATGATSSKAEQVAVNPRVEVCVRFIEEEHSGYLRLRGELKPCVEEGVHVDLWGCVGFMEAFWTEPMSGEYMLLELAPRWFEYMEPGMLEVTRGSF